jgi:hypothetical protein
MVYENAENYNHSEHFRATSNRYGVHMTERSPAPRDELIQRVLHTLDHSFHLNHQVSLDAERVNRHRNLLMDVLDALSKAQADSATPPKGGVDPLLLLKLATCPNCDGSGSVPRPFNRCCGNARPDGECCGYPELDVEQEQCQWCFERQLLLSPSSEQR